MKSPCTKIFWHKDVAGAAGLELEDDAIPNKKLSKTFKFDVDNTTL